MVEYFCCPSPTQNPELIMTDKVKTYRQALKTFVYGEFGALIGQGYLFGLVTGLFHLVHVWIIYSAFASLNFCATFVVCICALLELLLLFMNTSSQSVQHDEIFSDNTNKLVFYCLFAYSAVKVVASYVIFKELKQANREYHGGADEDDGFFNFAGDNSNQNNNGVANENQQREA